MLVAAIVTYYVTARIACIAPLIFHYYIRYVICITLLHYFAAIYYLAYVGYIYLRHIHITPLIYHITIVVIITRCHATHAAVLLLLMARLPHTTACQPCYAHVYRSNGYSLMSRSFACLPSRHHYHCRYIVAAIVGRHYVITINFSYCHCCSHTNVFRRRHWFITPVNVVFRHYIHTSIY